MCESEKFTNLRHFEFGLLRGLGVARRQNRAKIRVELAFLLLQNARGKGGRDLMMMRVDESVAEGENESKVGRKVESNRWVNAERGESKCKE